MATFVVDTNVGIVANGASEVTDLECRLACVEELEWLRDQGTVAVDDKLLVFDEYRKHLSLAGQPGVGDAFLKHIYDEQYKEDRVRRFEITPSDDERRGFEELPANSFDPSDRKFLAWWPKP